MIKHAYLYQLLNDESGDSDGNINIGIVREPTELFMNAVDENVPELGPPPELFSEFCKKRNALQDMEGYDDQEAHNTAWSKVNFSERYRSYLRNETTQEPIRRIVDASSVYDVTVVCYENTDKKRCHRILLLEYIKNNYTERPTVEI